MPSTIIWCPHCDKIMGFKEGKTETLARKCDSCLGELKSTELEILEAV